MPYLSQLKKDMVLAKYVKLNERQMKSYHMYVIENQDFHTRAEVQESKNYLMSVFGIKF